MTKADFTKMRKRIQSELYDWAVENFGSWEEFVAFAFVEGKVFTLPIHLVPPASDFEWNEAKPYGGQNTDIIEVTDCWLRGFCVMDGHNRLKTAIHEGKTEIKVRYGE